MSKYWRAQVVSFLGNVQVIALPYLADYAMRVANKPGEAVPVAIAAGILSLYLRSLITKAHVTAPAVVP